MTSSENKIVGQGVSRIDGILKVTGTANYATDWPIRNVAHAYLIKSTIAAGTVSNVDTATAEKSPGVIAVITHQNAMKLASYDAMRGWGMLQDAKVSFYGQHIGVVVAESYEQARYAARLVKVTYQEETPKVDFEKSLKDAVMLRNRADYARGDFDSTFGAAEHKIDFTYETPIEHHQPLEPHSAVAVWTDGKLTLYSGAQVIGGYQGAAVRAFGLKPEDVRVISPHVGGGFGSKGGAWAHVIVAALAAKMVDRPVKLALTRQNMFNSVGLRQRNRQRLRIAANGDGKITALAHDTQTHTATTSEFAEPCGELSRFMYDVPNAKVTYRVASMNIIVPTFQRAPGESTGSFALESAVDEMAHELGMDPIEFRLKNIGMTDPSNGRPFSSRATAEALKKGSEMFGWNRRKQKPGQNRGGELLTGYGVAAGSYPSRQSPTSAQVKLSRSGSDVTAVVELAASDLGTGTYTILSQIATETLDLPIGNITVKIGDSSLPPAAGSVGSIGAASFSNAVSEACLQARSELQAKTNRQWFVEPSMAQLMEAANLTEYQTRVDARPPQDANKYSSHAFNANFAEVTVNELTGMVRVQRIVAVTGAGKVLNAKTARSQIIGGCVWGIGMALTEESVVDPRSGHFVTRTFADYHVPVNLDVPHIDVAFIPEDDKVVNKLGVKGIGEVGIVGVAASIANAVFNATGKRVRTLPITPDKLL